MMAQHQTHDRHDHQHGSGCGHTAVRHGDHTDDYVHNGYLHHAHGTVLSYVSSVSSAGG
jgi:hypothetical protein